MVPSADRADPSTSAMRDRARARLARTLSYSPSNCSIRARIAETSSGVAGPGGSQDESVTVLPARLRHGAAPARLRHGAAPARLRHDCSPVAADDGRYGVDLAAPQVLILR